MDEEYEYLQPGFDPKSLTVPRLRSILVAHDVQYPATAKKGQLIDLFNEGVVPKAKKFLDKQAKAKRSSMGIVDMPRGDSVPLDGMDLAPPQSTSKRARSPRKTPGRVKTEEPEEPELPPITSPTKRKSRGTSRQVSEAYLDAEPAVPRSVRRSTRSMTPQVKVEDPDDDFFQHSRESENFSRENPFQSGSSPPANSRPSSSRRRTSGRESLDPQVDGSARRRTADHERPRSSKSFKSFGMPSNSMLREQSPEESSASEAGEEFTPEEQFELEMELATKGENAVQSRRPSKPAKKRTGLAAPLMALAFTALSCYAGWYRQEKVAVGYCGLGKPSPDIIPPELPVPDWVVPLVEPQCEPCPQHAYCYPDFSVRCESDFILTPNPFSLGGIVPLPPTCEPDGEKVRRIKIVADKAVEELRERRAQYECGELVDEAGEKESDLAIDEEKLREVISEKRSKKMNKQEFDDLWLAAIGEVKDREEVEAVE